MVPSRLSMPVPPTASARLEVELAAVAHRPMTPLWKLRESACAFVDAEKLAGRHAQAIISSVRQMAARAEVQSAAARRAGETSLAWTPDVLDEVLQWCIDRYIRHPRNVAATVAPQLGPVALTDTSAASDAETGEGRWQDDGGAQ